MKLQPITIEEPPRPPLGFVARWLAWFLGWSQIRYRAAKAENELLKIRAWIRDMGDDESPADAAINLCKVYRGAAEDFAILFPHDGDERPTKRDFAQLDYEEWWGTYDECLRAAQKAHPKPTPDGGAK